MNTDQLKRTIREEVARRKSLLLAEQLPEMERHERLSRVAVERPEGRPSPTSAPDIEAIMRSVREAVSMRRGGMLPTGPNTGGPSQGADRSAPELARFSQQEPIALPRLSMTARRIELKPTYDLDDFLQFHDDEFVDNAYRAILRREPDISGRATFLSALRAGRLAKTEIVGRLRFSTEGRSLGVRVRGLSLPFALRTLRRVPVFGRLLGVLQYVIRLPDIVRNHERLEATLFHRESELRRQLDAAESEIERLLASLGKEPIELARELNARLIRVQSEMFTAQQAANVLQRLDELGHAIRGELSKIDERLSHVESEKVARADADARFFSIDRALERKAEDERITALGSHLASRILGMANQEQLGLLSRQTTEQLQEVRERLDMLASAKADAVQLDVVRDAHGTQFDSLRMELERCKTEIGDVSAVVRDVHAKKADLARVEMMFENAHERQRELRIDAESLIAAKADRAEVERLSFTLAGSRADRLDILAASQTIEHVRNEVREQRRILLDQHRRVSALLEHSRRRNTEDAGERGAGVLAEYDHAFDAIYASFEDRFRGAPVDIKKRLEVYIPLVREAGAGSVCAPVLDVGCGRGDWLELLQEAGLTGTGVDLNRVNVADCRDRGLDVFEDDVLRYLRKLADDSLGAITGMHLVEHLPFRDVVSLIDESYRVLRPGGVLVLETPNPENLMVGACNFWFDPTHQRPLPPATMEYFVQARGFASVKIMRLHPYAEHERLAEGAPGVIQRINQAFYDAQDYAVIATKMS